MKSRKNIMIFILCFAFLLSYGKMPVLADTAAENTTEKYIALSFDDGPHPRFTPMILDLLAEYGIHATFFVIGQNASLYSAPLVRAAAEGHEIGNHTYTHPKMHRLTDEEMISEVGRCQEEIFLKTGKKPTLFRPPEGSHRKTEGEILTTFGLTQAMWEVDTRDWTGNSTQDIVKIVKQNVGGGKIILFHDYTVKENHTVSALKIIIPYLLEKGYRFTTVGNLLKTKEDGAN